VGKTALAIKLAKEYHSVIVSADSRQFYRELNIGTAKPTDEQLNEVTHYFVNNKSITELYGAGHYEKEVIPFLNELFEKRDLVFLVGGSGLYINAVLHGVDEFIDVPQEVRDSLNKLFEEKGLPAIQQKLKELDETYFGQVDLNNPQRIIRALEVCVHTGQPYSSFLNKEKPVRNFIPIKILINTKREKLYQQINKRVDEMMLNGLLEEVKQVSEYRNANALKTVGYKELYDYLDGKYDLKEAVEKIKQHTRNYAKRQLTWFKNRDEFGEFEPDDMDKIKAYIDLIISHG